MKPIWKASPEYLATSRRRETARFGSSSTRLFRLGMGRSTGFDRFFRPFLTHGTLHIEHGPRLYDEFSRTDIPADISGFSDIEQLLDVEFTLKAPFDDGIDATDFPFDSTGGAYDHFGVAVQVAFYPAIYADVFF